MAFAALGVSAEDATNIDLHQSISRLVYRHTGTMMEEVARHCLQRAFPGAGRALIPNTVGDSPKKFEIDCLVEDTDAIEIKWRDATTDGDHVRKEAQRVEATRDAGYTPVRLMFFEPKRPSAIRIQKNLAAHYRGVGGSYHKGDDAFRFIREQTGIDLRTILQEQPTVH
ncbi:restriction endonuclease R XbaI [Salipiger mucosus DSM 16094]|uniref:Restriction endonuclease R XbaI n=2 Tax=Salipiger mucosus TaxID=263378 RepID=S9S0X7_9RHOB|nr:restriction endonuclease R XbaI [Salipiger mucosus DSM 16094]